MHGAAIKRLIGPCTVAGEASVDGFAFTTGTQPDA